MSARKRNRAARDIQPSIRRSVKIKRLELIGHGTVVLPSRTRTREETCIFRAVLLPVLALPRIMVHVHNDGTVARGYIQITNTDVS